MPRIDAVWWDLELRYQKLDQGIADAKQKMVGMANFIRGNPTAAVAGLGAAAALVGVQLTKMGIQFDTTMRRVVSALPGGVAALAEWKAGLLALSRHLPESVGDLDQLALALRHIIQVGGPEMQQPAVALERLRIAAEAAAASGENLDSVIGTLDDLMDAFGTSGNVAAENYLKMFYAVSQGRAPLGDMLSVMQRLAPFAAESGVRIEQLASVVAAMFETGKPPMLAIRALRQALAGVDEEGRKVPRMAADLGVSISLVNGQLEVGGDLGTKYAEALASVTTNAGALGESLDAVRTGPGAEWARFMRDANVLALKLGDWMARDLGNLFTVTPEDRRLLEWLSDLVSGGRQPGAGGSYATAADLIAGADLTAAFRGHGARPAIGPTRAAAMGRPGVRTPDPEAAARLAATLRAQAEMTEDLRDRVTAAMGDAYDVAVRELDRLEAKFHEKFGVTLPAEVAKGLATLRGVALGGTALTELDRQVVGLAEKVRALTGNAHATTEEYQAQLAALSDMRSTLELGLQDTTLSTAQHEALRGKLQQIAALEHEVLEAKRSQGRETKVLLDRDSQRLEKLQAQARNIEAAARGALQLARAFGLVDEKTAAALENVAQLAANIPSLLAAISAGGAAGIVAAVLPVAGALAGLLQGLTGESPEEKARKEALRANTEAILQLAQGLGDFGLNVTGTQMGGVRTAIGSIQQRWPQSGDWMYGTQAKLQDALRQAGVGLDDLRKVAEALGITFAGVLPTLQELDQLLQAIDFTELTQFTNTFAGKMQAFQAEVALFDLDGPLDQLRLFRDRVAEESDALKLAFGDFDLGTPEGLAAFEANIQALFRQLQAGTLTAAQLGGLTPDEFLQTLLQLEGWVDSITASGAVAGGGQQQWGVNRTITEATATRQLSLMTTMAYWLEVIGGDTGLLSGRLAPPSDDALRRYKDGASAGGLTVGEIKVTVQVAVGAGATAADGAAVGRAAGTAAAEEVNAQLYQLAQRRARALGQATLN
jgi:hypothetical protein